MRQFFLIIVLIFLNPFSAPALAQTDKLDAITVGVYDNPPFIIKTSDGQYDGFAIDLVREFSLRTGREFDVHEFTDWGTMIDITRDGGVDMSITNITITSVREKLMDYSQPIYDSGQIVLIAGKKGSPFLAYARLIWDSGIFYYLLGALGLLLIIAHVLWFFERNVKDAEHDYFRDDYFGGIWDSFCWAFVVMAMGGFEKERPHKVLSRLLAMFWILLSLFFISTLTAKMTTAMTVDKLSTGIGSVSDLPGKRVGTFRSPGLTNYLENLGISSIDYAKTKDLYDALERGELDAVIGDEPILRYYASTKGKGKVKIIGQKFRVEKYGALFPQGATLREEFDHALIQMQEDGHYQDLLDKYFEDR
jgi:polar amino acid transport system substrate-binding protein